MQVSLGGHCGPVLGRKRWVTESLLSGEDSPLSSGLCLGSSVVAAEIISLSFETSDNCSTSVNGCDLQSIQKLGFQFSHYSFTFD